MPITVPDDPLTAGASVQVCVSGDPDTTVTVTVDDGSQPTPQTQEIEITIGGDGQGCLDWQVPSWGLANFNAPGCEEVTRRILQPTGP